MATTTRLLALVPLLLAAAACGSESDSDSSADAAAPAATEAESSSDDDSDDSGEDASTPPAAGGGAATLTLANGETFEFSNVLCALEPQMSAGSEILFTAVSYDDPSLDITQFGSDGTVTDVAAISVYDGDFETLWEANSMFGQPVELALEGSTIRGTGSFLPGPDLIGDAVEGEVVANC